MREPDALPYIRSCLEETSERDDNSGGASRSMCRRPRSRCISVPSLQPSQD